uniref:Uncharacterized protein n=1 Tax=Tetraselmis sp. GSL018 TaxID=582737 RepID=A0A061RXF4_9CHLO
MSFSQTSRLSQIARGDFHGKQLRTPTGGRRTSLMCHRKASPSASVNFVPGIPDYSVQNSVVVPKQPVDFYRVSTREFRKQFWLRSAPPLAMFYLLGASEITANSFVLKYFLIFPVLNVMAACGPSLAHGLLVRNVLSSS